MISFSDKHKAIFWHSHKTGGSYLEFILKHYYDFKQYNSTINPDNDDINNILDNFKQETKEETKEEQKEETKQETKEETKQEIKEETKEETKEEIKEETKEETKTLIKQLQKYKKENMFLKKIILDKNIGNLGNILQKYNNEKNVINIRLEQWETYFKFTFVRNPYDKAISSYEFIKQKQFDDRVNKEVLNEDCTFTNFYKNQFKYNDNGFMHYHAYETQYTNFKNNTSDIQIDYIAKYEKINEEIIHILKQIGIEDYTKHLHLIDENCRINASQKKNLTEYFTDDALKIINILFHDDFEKFGYKKFYNLEELNNYLGKIEQNENEINSNLLKFYNYQPKILTEEDIINSFIN
jgi:hypothetical protein